MNIQLTCPVLEDTHQIQDLSHDLTKTMRKLRRDLACCVKCPSYDECGVLKDFNAMIQQAIQEVNAEWDLTQSINIQEN